MDEWIHINNYNLTFFSVGRWVIFWNCNPIIICWSTIYLKMIIIKLSLANLKCIKKLFLKKSGFSLNVKACFWVDTKTLQENVAEIWKCETFSTSFFKPLKFNMLKIKKNSTLSPVFNFSCVGAMIWLLFKRLLALCPGCDFISNYSSEWQSTFEPVLRRFAIRNTKSASPRRHFVHDTSCIKKHVWKIAFSFVWKQDENIKRRVN